MRQPARQNVVEHKTCCENCDIPYAVKYDTKESHLSMPTRLARRSASAVGKYVGCVQLWSRTYLKLLKRRQHSQRGWFLGGKQPCMLCVTSAEQ